MRGLWVLRTSSLAGWLFICLARPSLAGPPPAPAPLGFCVGVGVVIGAVVASSLVGEDQLHLLWLRVAALHSRQIDEVDLLSVHFSLHNLGKYESCQSELRALLPFYPVCSRPSPKHTPGTNGTEAVTDHMFVVTGSLRDEWRSCRGFVA
jgi:hypothetical protein